MAAFDRFLRRRVGVPLEEARRHDVLRAFRGSEWDDAFPADRMVPALEWTLDGLGIDLTAQQNVAPRPRAAAAEEPARVLRADRGSRAGDARHQADGRPRRLARVLPRGRATPSTSRTSRPTSRSSSAGSGDNSVTEGWAMLFEHLVDDPAWLSRRLDFARPEDFAEESAVSLLYVVRRYAGKLLYELELHGDVELESMRAATSSCCATRRRSSRRRRTTSQTSTRASTAPATCAHGRFTPRSSRTSARSSDAPGSRARRPARSSGRSGPRVSGSLRPSCSTRWRGRRSSWPRWARESRRRSRYESEEDRHRRCGRPRLPQLQRRLPGTRRRPGGRLHGDADPRHRGARLPGRAGRLALPGRHPDPSRGGARRPRAPRGRGRGRVRLLRRHARARHARRLAGARGRGRLHAARARARR